LIAKKFCHLPLLTGGSGILTELGRILSENIKKPPELIGVPGKAIILAGSCSPATREQVKHYKERGGPSFVIERSSIGCPKKAIEMLWNKIIKIDCGDVLVYAPGSEDQKIKTGDEHDATSIERIVAGIAQKAVLNGYRRIIVAGGETSGAVTKALDYNAYYIGKSIAPGVPVMQPLEAPHIRLVLKSGNFGQEDFFIRSLHETGIEE
jgi:uncharacterized protein YgbK (DUF1537 family)